MPTFEVRSLRRPPLEDVVAAAAAAVEVGEVTTAGEPEAGAAVEDMTAFEDAELPPTRLPTFEVKSLRRPSLEDVVAAAAAAAVEVGEVAAADEPDAGVAVEMTAFEDVEAPPIRLPTSEVKSLRRPPLEDVAAAAATVEVGEVTTAGESETGVALEDVIAAAAAEVGEVTTAGESETGGVVEDMLVVEDVVPLRRLPTSEVKSLRRPPLEDVAAAAATVEVGEVTTAGESETGVALEDVIAAAAAEVDEVTTAGESETGVVVEETTALEDVAVVEIELTPRRLPTFEVKSPRRPSLEVVVEGDVVEASADESTADSCWLVAPASVDAASEFCVLVFSVLEPSVCVVVVVVLVGSPPMVVVPVIRWVISGFLGSTEIVTTTTSCPC